MPDLKNVRLVIEWEDQDGKQQSLRWETDQARVNHSEVKNITPDHVELLKNGVDVKARSCVELKMEYISIVKGEEKSNG